MVICRAIWTFYEFIIVIMQKIIIIAGTLLLIVGLLWPLLTKIALGRLPGDIIVNRPTVKIFVPITTMILVSIIISVVLWLLRK